jgi:3-deoxy-D-manno-octulosonic-acid transferase
VVAGSTTEDETGIRANWEEVAVMKGWREVEDREPIKALLVIAPRHPERFVGVESVAIEFRYALVSKWLTNQVVRNGADKPREVVILDTIGDLAAVYSVADIAFVGGSLVKRGGHNPLEPAQFGVPVVMGPSYENFRDIVSSMQKANAIRIVQDSGELHAVLVELLANPKVARAMGERGRSVFEKQQGATGRAIEAILTTLQVGAKT